MAAGYYGSGKVEDQFGNPDLALGIIVIHEEKLEEDADGDDEASES